MCGTVSGYVGEGYNPHVTAFRERAWALLGAAGLLVGATWLRTGSGWVLAAGLISVALVAVATWRGRPTAAAIAFAGVLAGFALLEASSALRQRRFMGQTEAELQALEARATRAMADRLTAEAKRLAELATEALDVPTNAEMAFAALEDLRGGNATRAIAVARGGVLTAWAGHYLAAVDSLSGPVGVVANEFYLSLYALAGRGQDRAVATTLLHAESPAEALATALDADMAADYEVAGFAYALPADSGDGAAVVRVAGIPVLAVRAVALGAPELVQRLEERSRERGIAALALALLLFLVATWRSGDAGERFGALAVTIGAIALVPLADLSNRSPLFNPAYFYVAEGGPLTASIGALALTSVTVLVAVLALQRARLFPQVRWRAGLLILVVATVGPFLLGAITRGIRFPGPGAPIVLWLAWETAVFLTAVVILIVGLAAGEAVMGSRRGVPLWIPPIVAGVVTALAKFVVLPEGGLPQWYTVLWVATIILMAVARPGPRTIWSAATVAAFGSVALVWSETVKARVILAEQDVAGLSTSDPAALALVQRFPAALDSATAPRSRVELLARYARSDLASGDLPVHITSWSPGGAVIADLRVGLGPGTARGLEFFARDAIQKMRPVLTSVPGNPGLLTILAYPHTDGSATTVVVAPRTRLVAPDPFPTMTGLGRSRDAGGQSPYTLQFAPAGIDTYITTVAQWTRRNEELHGDWFLPPLGGEVLHVHARVPLTSFGPLVARGALMACANLLLVAFIWLLLIVADGGARRWLRHEGRAWLRSYRLRLSVSLFAAFMLPAGAFAGWSYVRLADEDAQARDLLVRETLRGVTAAPGAGLDSLAARFQTPLFLFAGDVMVATSDPLFDALAPIGRLLPAEAARQLIRDDEGFATAALSVGGEAMRFGFRVVEDTASATPLVLAAPARTVELALDPRRRDLAFFVLFATVVGALLALWISGIAGRSFSRPIGELRAGALALAAGEREPQLAGNPPPEFAPVFTAFREMARDLEAGRARDARAQRVLAWGEMARQVAHEIKNPLTPMRLGVQHLQRAKDDPRVDFRQVFDENADRLLAEINRLDEIARAFSRYGTAPDAQPAAEAVDVSEAVRDVVRLERLGGEALLWEMTGTDAPMHALARGTELREVLLNVLENARLAESRRVAVAVAKTPTHVTITVRDDGHGIAPDALSRVFEPHFSTRTSGSGLGLAISRRMIDGWGGTIGIASEPGVGTTLTISLVPAPPG